MSDIRGTGTPVIRQVLPLAAALLLTLSYNSAAQERMIPNDPFFKFQVSFDNDGGQVVIDATSRKRNPVELNLYPGIHLQMTHAWAITTGSRQTVVALLDDGFFYNHEDIRENIWHNKGEIGLDGDGYPKETNGVDDDGNGYVDDVIGWDFAFDDPDPDCYIFDGKLTDRIATYSHSIDAMGIIGAHGNNGVGVAGINWEVSMMLLKCAAQGDTGRERTERTARAIRYAVDNGARAINWSGFVQEDRPEKLALLKDAIDYAESKGVLLIVAAGNDAKDIDLEENRLYPACFENDNIIVVAEIDFDGTLYKVPEGSKFIGGSNYGAENVDIAALAQNYTTQLRENCSIYGLGGGTSDAAPVVTGVAALVFSLRPDLSGPQVKEILMRSATKLPALEGKVKSAGMVNAWEALKLAAEFSNK
jgi:thermitase